MLEEIDTFFKVDVSYKLSAGRIKVWLFHLVYTTRSLMALLFWTLRWGWITVIKRSFLPGTKTQRRVQLEPGQWKANTDGSSYGKPSPSGLLVDH